MRTRLSDTEAKEILDTVYPEAKEDTELYEDVWGDIIEASSKPNVRLAMSVLCGVPGMEKIIESIHSRNPWTPSPEDAIIVKLFLPYYLRLVLSFWSPEKPSLVDGKFTEEFLAHVNFISQKVVDSVVKKEANSNRLLE